MTTISKFVGPRAEILGPEFYVKLGRFPGEHLVLELVSRPEDIHDAMSRFVESAQPCRVFSVWVKWGIFTSEDAKSVERWWSQLHEAFWTDLDKRGAVERAHELPLALLPPFGEVPSIIDPETGQFRTWQMARTMVLASVSGAVLMIDLSVFDELPVVIGQFFGDPYLIKVTLGWRLHAGFLTRRFGILPEVNGLIDLGMCGEGRLVGHLRVGAGCLDAVRLLVKDGPMREVMERVLPLWQTAAEPLFPVILEEDLARPVREMYSLGQAVLDLAILNFMPDEPTTDEMQDLVSRALAKLVRVVWKANWEMYSTTEMGRNVQGEVWERTDLRGLFQNSRSFVEPAKTLYYDNYRALLREYQVARPGNPLIWVIPPIHLPLSPGGRFPTVSRMMFDELPVEAAWMPEGLEKADRMEALRALLAHRQQVLGRVDVEWRLAIVPGYEDAIECFEDIDVEDLWWLRYQDEEARGISREVQRDCLDMDAVRRRLRQIRRLRETPGVMAAVPQPEVDYVLPRRPVDRPGGSLGRGSLLGDPRTGVAEGATSAEDSDGAVREVIPKPERTAAMARPVVTSGSSGASSAVRATPAESSESEWPVGPSSAGPSRRTALREEWLRRAPGPVKPPRPVRVKAPSESSGSSRGSARGPTMFWKNVGMESMGGPRYGWGVAAPVPKGVSSTGRRQPLHRWHPTGVQEESKRDVIRRLFRQFLKNYSDRPERVTEASHQRRDFLFAVLLAQFPFLEVMPETWAFDPVVVEPELLPKQILPFALPSADGPLNWFADQNQQFRARGSRCVDDRVDENQHKWEAQSRLSPGEFFKVVWTQANGYASKYEREAKECAKGAVKEAASHGKEPVGPTTREPVKTVEVKGAAVAPVSTKRVLGRGRASRPVITVDAIRPGGMKVVIKEPVEAPVLKTESAVVKRRQERERDEQRAEEDRWGAVRRAVTTGHEAQRLVQTQSVGRQSWWDDFSEEPSQIRVNLDLGDGSRHQIRATMSASVIMQGTEVVGRARQQVVQHLELAPGISLAGLGLGPLEPRPLPALGPVGRPLAGISEEMERERERMLNVWDNISAPRTPRGPRSPAPPSPVMSD